MTYEKLYAFLLEHYRRSRFEGRGMDKAKRITEMYMEDLQKYGCSYISRHEDVQGQGFKFDSDLNIFRGDYVEYPNNAGNLTHIFEVYMTDYRKRASIAEQENARLREELNRRPKYEWFVEQARKALNRPDTVPPQQLIPQIRQLKEASERRKAMRNQPEIPIDTVVEWHYNHWDNDEWSASQGVLKYRKGNFILIELDGEPIVLDGKELTMRPYKERPETKFFKKVFASS